MDTIATIRAAMFPAVERSDAAGSAATVMIIDDSLEMIAAFESLLRNHYDVISCVNRLMRIPVLMITALEDLKCMADSFAAGAAALLPKSFTREQLPKALQTFLNTQPDKN